MIPLVVDALAVYRLTRLATRDELTRPLREKYLEPYLDDALLDGLRGIGATPTRLDVFLSRVAYGASCPWCLSVWLAAAVAVARRTTPARWEPLAEVLATAAAAGLLLDRDRG